MLRPGRERHRGPLGAPSRRASWDPAKVLEKRGLQKPVLGFRDNPSGPRLFGKQKGGDYTHTGKRY